MYNHIITTSYMLQVYIFLEFTLLTMNPDKSMKNENSYLNLLWYCVYIYLLLKKHEKNT